jgi:hypothetical protein
MYLSILMTLRGSVYKEKYIDSTFNHKSRLVYKEE